MISSLVVIDLDTALLGPDGSIDRTDRDAILQARGRGITLAFVSGKRFASVCACLRAQGIDGWVIGGDGAQLGLSRGDRMIGRNTIAAAIAVRAREVLITHELEPFALTTDGVHGPSDREERARTVIGETVDAYLTRAPLVSDIHALVAAGPASAVSAAAEALAMLAPSRVRASLFLAGDEHGVRVDACRSTRARAIRDVAARVKVRRPQIAYIGGALGGYVDRSPFEQLAHVFVPEGFSLDLAPHAEMVRRAAGRGAVAEAFSRWTQVLRLDPRSA